MSDYAEFHKGYTFIDIDSFIALKKHWGSENATRQQGDWDGDQDVDANDFAILKQVYGGRDFLDPKIPDKWNYGSFTGVPLFGTGPKVSDVAQGAVGDCWYLGVLASLAACAPDHIRSILRQEPLIVRALMTRFDGSELDVLMDYDFPVNDSGNPVYAEVKPRAWVAFLEKALAALRYNSFDYSVIGSGWGSEAWTWLIGDYEAKAVANLSDAELKTWIRRGLDNYGASFGVTNNNHPQLVKQHLYGIVDMDSDGVLLYNPWGVDGGTNGDDNYRDGLVKITFEQMRTAGWLLEIGVIGNG